MGKGEYVIQQHSYVNPFPNDKFLSANNNFEYDENCSEFSKKVENTVGKGEIARYVKGGNAEKSILYVFHNIFCSCENKFQIQSHIYFILSK